MYLKRIIFRNPERYQGTSKTFGKTEESFNIGTIIILYSIIEITSRI